ncbi:unnamed protein product [Mytilus coruscus]|uniref:Uncharacterized protein n=1 Tax=Mytilus coruscus TaxID=42192 RepID=A0A6J8EU61_MYTCO|nr:unnamed protein product [Mytilus coruscus]
MHSSPSILDCQLLMNGACKSGDIENICCLLELCDPDIFEVRSAIHHAFDTLLTEERIITCTCITFVLLRQCHCVASDIQAAIETASRNEMLSLMILHSLNDIQETTLEICRRGDIESMMIVLFDRFYKNFINESCMNNAFASGSLKLIPVLIKDFPEINFDKKVALNNASTNGNISVVQWLFHKYAISPNRRLPFLEPILDLKLARTIFDLNSAMRNACRNGNTDVVQWLLQIFPYEIFDMRLGLIETSVSGNADLVKWMLAVYENDIFDIETSVMSACAHGKIRIVQFFLQIWLGCFLYGNCCRGSMWKWKH